MLNFKIDVLFSNVSIKTSRWVDDLEVAVYIFVPRDLAEIVGVLIGNVRHVEVVVSCHNEMKPPLKIWI